MRLIILKYVCIRADKKNGRSGRRALLRSGTKKGHLANVAESRLPRRRGVRVCRKGKKERNQFNKNSIHVE